MIIPYGDINPKRGIPVVNYLIIGACIFVFFMVVSPLGERQRESLFYLYGIVPARLKLEAFFTSLFLHSDVFHLFGNMLFLWICGDNVEDSMGHFKYLVFYLICGLASGLAHVVSVTGGFEFLPCVGASGAISGILGSYMILFPGSRIKFFYVWFFIGTFTLPAVVAIGVWFAMQVLYASLSGYADGVAYGAHIGGFIFGLAFTILLVKLGICRKTYYRRPAVYYDDF